ncbi:DUF2087 domain-containing protein [Burkholderia ubonensis]|nr:DUF2087 domain-containing protein [Burkholderia ubonensis]
MNESANAHAMPGRSDTLAIVEKLLSKRGVMLGNMSPGDMATMLALASLAIPADTPLDEAAVNQALIRWLSDTGSMLRIDHVELRRTLIDLRYWQRDGFGRSYERQALPAGHGAQAHVAALEAVDIERFVADARARHEALRTERMAAHARKSATAD